MSQNLKDTTIGIWDYLYKVRIPFLDTFTPEYLEKFGVPMPTDKKAQAEQLDSLVTTYINIDAMVEHYKKGVCIRVVEAPDTKLIYDAIQSHLMAWEVALRYGQNIGESPMEDLLTMDQFANDVYEHARFHFKQNEAKSEFIRSLQNNNASISNMFTKVMIQQEEIPGVTMVDGVTTINPSTGAKLPERESMSDFLMNRLNTIHNRGGL